VEYELPPQSVVPAERDYKYVATRDEIDTLTRPEKEIKDRYARLIAQVAIRTIHEVLISVPPEVASVVTFYGHVSTTDMATGQPIRPCLISVRAERDVFSTFVLADLDPVFNEAVECRTRQPVHLFQCPAAQFGPVGHRRSQAAATRSAQSGIASVTGTVATVPVRAAASSS
jgi:hypothetical protein